MALTTGDTYSVTFVAEYFTLTTNQHGITEQDAIDKAFKFMKDHYGYDLEDVIIDIDVEWQDQ